MNIDSIYNTVTTTATELLVSVGLKVLGALVIWVVGRWLIRFGLSLIARALRSRKIDKTISSYVDSVLGVLLNVVLIVAVLGFFGVETTSFAAFLAAAGVAIGMAWSGLLAHLAAGAFLLILRPIKVGDFITAGGVTGTVKEIGLFVTAIDTPDNVRTYVGNNKIFSDNIQNFHTNKFRRVDLVAQLPHSADPQEAAELLRKAIAKLPKVLKDPAPDVEVLEFNLAGPVLAVRPYTKQDDYWTVYFAANAAIKKTFVEAGYATPEQHLRLQGLANAA